MELKIKYWIGCKYNATRIPFRQYYTPTKETHGHLYWAVIGPFKTWHGAKWGAEHKYFQGTISEIEKKSKIERKLNRKLDKN